MKKFAKAPVFLLLLFFASCMEEAGHSASEEAAVEITENAEYTADPDTPLYSTAAEYSNPDKEFIRTADLSLEVKDVYDSTVRIESNLAEIGGYVMDSRMETRIWSEESFPVNADSMMQVRTFRIENRMTLRVPEAALGKFLISLGEEMEFLNYRYISLDDVTLHSLFAQMESERSTETREQLSTLLTEKGKTKDKASVIQSVDQNRAEANREKIKNLQLRDDIAFSTVELLIKEKEKTVASTVVNTRTHTDRFRPTLTYRAGLALKGGYHFLETIAVGILYLWPVWLIGIPLFFFGRRLYLRN